MAILKTTLRSTGEVLHEQGGYDEEELRHWIDHVHAELGSVYLLHEILEEV